jgi:hypothetical protein
VCQGCVFGCVCCGCHHHEAAYLYLVVSSDIAPSLPSLSLSLPPHTHSDLELAYKLHLEAEQAAAAAAAAAAEDGGSGGEVEQSAPVDFSGLSPGALASVKLDQMAEYGAIMDIVGQEDLVGLVHPHQGASDAELLGGECEGWCWGEGDCLRRRFGAGIECAC